MNAGIMAGLQIPMTVIVKAIMAGAAIINADTGGIQIVLICMQVAVLLVVILLFNFVKGMIIMVILAMHIMYVSSLL